MYKKIIYKKIVVYFSALIFILIFYSKIFLSHSLLYILFPSVYISVTFIFYLLSVSRFIYDFSVFHSCCLRVPPVRLKMSHFFIPYILSLQSVLIFSDLIVLSFLSLTFLHTFSLLHPLSFPTCISGFQQFRYVITGYEKRRNKLR